jgi:hypothetical protein
MVEQSGSDNVFNQVSELRGRVRDIEGWMRHQAEETAQITAALSGVRSTIDSVVIQVTDIGKKLDESRTRRPNMVPIISVIIAAFTLITIIGTLAFAPVWYQIREIKDQHTNYNNEHMTRENRISALEQQITDNAKGVRTIEKRLQFIEHSFIENHLEEKKREILP